MKKISIKLKRQFRNRKKLKEANMNRLRISVTKSLNNISAQIIDDKLRKTLVSASSTEKEIKMKKIKKIEKSSIVGELLAKRAQDKNIVKVYFDRGSNKYHGRVKTFAESSSFISGKSSLYDALDKGLSMLSSFENCQKTLLFFTASSDISSHITMHGSGKNVRCF